MKCVCVVRKWGRVLREFFFESLEQINGKGDAHLVRPVKPLQLLQTLLSPAEWRTGRSTLEINNLDCFWKEMAGIQEFLPLAVRDRNHTLLFLLPLKQPGKL